MDRYGNLSGSSGVVAYENGDDYIRVQFKRSGTYLYTYGSTGVADIETMKELAVSGMGLGTFIIKNVKKRYQAKE